MSNSTGANLIIAAKARSARTSDTVLITDAFVLSALNEGQVQIVNKTPRLIGLDLSDTTTYRIATWSTTATAVTVAVRVSGVVTLTAAGHSLEVGDMATVADVANDTDFDGNVEILSVSGNDITYFQNLADDDGVGATFGTIVQIAAKAKLDISSLAPVHIGGVWILNGGATRQQGMKYRTLEDFRSRYIPVSNEGSGEPDEYTRQSNTLLFNRPISSDYAGLRFQIDYTKKATDLADDATASIIPDSDKGLLLFTLAEIYDEIAASQPQFEAKALKTRVLFNQWLDDYQDNNLMKLEELYDD